MAEISTAQEVNLRKSDFSNKMLHKMIKVKAPDVHFIFEDENEKVPAHKDLLAVSSEVFDTMFNGELKEKGDVKIVDASAAAFREFLQFFYNDEVALTMENIADVLNLTHQYDVTECFNVAIEFLKENLSTDQMMFGLEMAINFQSDDLKTFCKQRIANDVDVAVNVFNQFEYSDVEGAVKISTKYQLLSKTNLASVFAEVQSIAKEIIVDKSNELSRLRPKCLIPCIFTDPKAFVEINTHNLGLFGFKWNKSMYLSEIHFTEVYIKGSKTIPVKGNLHIYYISSSYFANCSDVSILRCEIEKNIILTKPLHLAMDRDYYIKIKLPRDFPSYILAHAYNSEPKIMGITISNQQKHSLIERLVFDEVRYET